MVPTFDLYIQPFLDCLKGGGEKNLKTLSEELIPRTPRNIV